MTSPTQQVGLVFCGKLLQNAHLMLIVAMRLIPVCGK